MEFKHILVPYDGSEPSIDALNKAIWLASLSPATKLTVANVLYMQPVVVADMTFFPTQEYQNHMQQHANALLESVEEKLSGLSDTNVVVLSGPPAPTLLNYAEAEDCDLIVMGSRGLSTIKELMLGSVSHNVVQSAKIPVLIVK